MSDDEYGVFALNIDQGTLIQGDYLVRMGDLKEKRGLYWDEQCRYIAEEISDEYNLGVSKFNRVSMKVTYWLYENEPEFLSNIMDELWGEI